LLCEIWDWYVHRITFRIAVMTIYDFPIGPYPARVRIALAEKNLQAQVSFVLVDLRKGQHKQTEFLKLNYSDTVPVLELDDGTLIAECTAITEYLDALDGNPILTGKTPREKGLIHMMNKRAEIELLDAISMYFHHATPGLGPEVETYQNPEWGFRQRDKALKGMGYFNDIFSRHHFVAGETFSMADITVIAGMIFAELVKLPVPPEYQALAAWYESMTQRPSVRDRVAMSRPR